MKTMAWKSRNIVLLDDEEEGCYKAEYDNIILKVYYDQTRYVAKVIIKPEFIVISSEVHETAEAAQKECDELCKAKENQ
jgi:hypothetical protein